MGPMLLLVLGILCAVGLSLYQFGEHHRFDMTPDNKGGIFIIDRKSAAINHCDEKTCSLVGNGALPSQIMSNPAALASMQGAIIGAPAAVAAPKPGATPSGMKANIAKKESREEVQDADESGAGKEEEDSNNSDSAAADSDSTATDSDNESTDSDSTTTEE